MAFPGPPELGMCLEVKKQLSKKKLPPAPLWTSNGDMRSIKKPIFLVFYYFLFF